MRFQCRKRSDNPIGQLVHDVTMQHSIFSPALLKLYSDWSETNLSRLTEADQSSPGIF